MTEAVSRTPRWETEWWKQLKFRPDSLIKDKLWQEKEKCNASVVISYNACVKPVWNLCEKDKVSHAPHCWRVYPKVQKLWDSGLWVFWEGRCESQMGSYKVISKEIMDHERGHGCNRRRHNGGDVQMYTKRTITGQRDLVSLQMKAYYLLKSVY